VSGYSAGHDGRLLSEMLFLEHLLLNLGNGDVGIILFEPEHSFELMGVLSFCPEFDDKKGFFLNEYE
jgi:hypothetical protein